MQTVKKLFRLYPRFTLISVIILALIGSLIIHNLHGTSKTSKETSAQTISTQNNTPAIAPVDAQPAPPSITGFGALLADWNNYHTVDPNFDSNRVYDPTPNTGTDSSHTDKYYAVVSSSGRVTDYNMRLPNGSNLTNAQKEVMLEFPSDASVLWQQNKGQCVQMEIASTTLGTALGNPSVSGGSQGQAFVELNTDTTATESQLSSYFDPANVNAAAISQNSYAAAGEAPGC